MKETKAREQKKDTTPNRDPDLTGMNYDEFFNNRLSLPEGLKEYLSKQGLDWRFINASDFRQSGGVHRSHWRPFRVQDLKEASADELGISMTNAEGMIQRGDLLLGVRPKPVTQKHREFLRKRTALHKSVNKKAARELREQLRDAGGAEYTKVHEGYDDN